MTRRIVILNSPSSERLAHEYVTKATQAGGYQVEFKKATRTTDQNAKMWAGLNDIAKQVDWHGQKLAPEDWKLILMEALSQELRLVPNLDGNGFVPLGRSSSRLTKGEMSDLIELMLAFGAKHGVTWSDQKTGEQQ